MIIPAKVTLDPHQVVNSDFLSERLQEDRCGFDFSDCGTGKMWTGFASLYKAGLKPLYVGNKSGLGHARYVASQFWDEPIYAETWQSCWREGHEPPIGDGYGWFFDEGQFGQSFKSNQGKFFAKQGRRRPFICATGTPPDSPLKWANFLHASGKVPRHHFYEWVKDFGCERVPWGNKHWTFDGGIEHIERIKEIFAPQTVRTCWRDLPDYPENKIYCEPISIESPSKLNSLAETLAKTNPSELGDIQQVRQAIEMLKVDAIVEMAKSIMDQKCSVFIAVNFTESLKAIAAGLGTDLIINGEVTGDRRDVVIDQFQKSTTPKALVANVVAGGTSISLHDMSGVPRQSIICPSWSAQNFVQSLFRIHRRGSKSAAVQRVVFADRSFESRIMEVLQNKIHRVETILDADMDIKYHVKEGALA